MSEKVQDIVAEMHGHTSGSAKDAWYTPDKWKDLCRRLDRASKEDELLLLFLLDIVAFDTFSKLLDVERINPFLEKLCNRLGVKYSEFGESICKDAWEKRIALEESLKEGK